MYSNRDRRQTSKRKAVVVQLLLKHPSSDLFWTEWDIKRYAALSDEPISREEAIEELVQDGFQIVWLESGGITGRKTHSRSSISDSKVAEIPILSSEEPTKPGRTGTKHLKSDLGSVMANNKDVQQLRIDALEARLAFVEAMLTKVGFATPNTATINPETLYKADEAGELMRCGKTNVYDLWQSGKLAVVNTGNGKKGKRVRGAAIIKFLESNEQGGPAPTSSFKHLKMR